MSTAAERLAALDSLPALELCIRAAETLDQLVSVMNEETTLLRSGKAREATALSAKKTALAQDYMGLARSVQRQSARLQAEAPQAVDLLRKRHERLATQMAENLKVIATARDVTEDLLNDVATAVTARNQPNTYGAGGKMTAPRPNAVGAVAINRSL